MKNKNSLIFIFACEWIPYTSADNAGVSKLSYPVNTRIFRVNCTGRITPAHLINAFKQDAAGVLVAGCAEGECHYVNGNSECLRVIEETKQLLNYLGIEPDRLKFEMFAEMDGARFAEVVTTFSEEIAKLEQVGKEVKQ